MDGQGKGQIVGYVRVSAVDQNEGRQVVALGEVDRLFSEKVSGKNVGDRQQLQELIAYVRQGDTVRVKSPDRLSRSTRDLLDLIELLKAKGVAVEFVDNPALDTNTPHGEFMLSILAAVSQLERAVIRERQAEGIAVAKAEGVYRHARRLDDEQIGRARELISAGVPKAVVARELGCSRQTLYTALAGTGSYRSVSAPSDSVET